MDKKSKIFFLVFGLILVGSIAFTYWKIVVNRDYLVLAEASCDPETEACFVYECDPEEEECTGDPEEDISYYAKIKKKAFNFPDCSGEECPDLVCEEGETDCEIILCTEDNAEEWETCNDPEEYESLGASDKEQGTSEEGEEEENDDSEEGNEEEEDASGELKIKSAKLKEDNNGEEQVGEEVEEEEL